MNDLISRKAAIDALNRTSYVDAEDRQISVAVIKTLPSAQPEIIRCKDCIYYDPPHIENNGERYEYKDMPKEAFDIFGTYVSCEYGINVGGRCERDYNVAYDDDKRVFVPESNFCGRARRRTNGSD